MKITSVLVFSVLLLSTSGVAFAESLWLTDFNAAKKQAAERQVPILIDFTGSDWCGWCIRLDNEVFSTEEFKRFAKGNLVLLKIDFPRRTRLPAAEAAANQALARKYQIRGYPTILLTDHKGNELARTGYQEGGPSAYVEHLQKLLNK